MWLYVDDLLAALLKAQVPLQCALIVAELCMKKARFRDSLIGAVGNFASQRKLCNSPRTNLTDCVSSSRPFCALSRQTTKNLSAAWGYLFGQRALPYTCAITLPLSTLTCMLRQAPCTVWHHACGPSSCIVSALMPSSLLAFQAFGFP